jgi:cobalamin biosynthesis Co2+ chelatase CbiK
MLNEDEIEKIKEEVKKEFPEDDALQQVHIARKIISKEAQKLGISYSDYIKQFVREIKPPQ